MSKPVIAISMNYMQLGTYHQFHIRDKYIDAVTEVGGLPMPIPCTEDETMIRQYLSMADALVIIGGLDYPPVMYGQEPHPSIDVAHERRALSDPILFQIAKEMKMPILGICAGLQLMNIAMGGQLIQHLATVEKHIEETYHPVRITGGRWLKAIFEGKPILANSNHHQAADPAYIGKGFEVSALSEDGVVEAIELNTEQMVLGVQWHPERNCDEEHRCRVFEFLLHKAREYREQLTL